MNSALALEQAFVFDTPSYGLAARAGTAVRRWPRVVIHPAPRALIDELMPEGHAMEAVELAPSTSAAAMLVAQGEADLALTPANAARLHNLQFISPARPIRMLWSVFVRSSPAGRQQRVEDS